MTARFVILQHDAHGGEHWDLLLEHADALLTWRLSCDPTDRANLPVHARRIFDHRKAYLEYEGPVSNSRGTVRRLDTGTVQFEQITPSRYVVTLAGGRLAGRFSLTKEGDDWVFSAAETGA